MRETLHRWQDKGLVGLWDAPHPGAQPRWQVEDLEYIESCLREEQRTYNSHQLARKLALERQVSLPWLRTYERYSKKGGRLETNSTQLRRKTRACRESN